MNNNSPAALNGNTGNNGKHFESMFLAIKYADAAQPGQRRHNNEPSPNTLMTLLNGLQKQLNKHGLIKKFFNHLTPAAEN